MCALIWGQGKESNVCFLDFESDYLLPTKFLYRTEECALSCPSLDLTEFILFIFNWRIIALQCCISFWCTAISLHISPSFWNLPPPPTHPTPLGCHRALGWAELPLLYNNLPLDLCVTYGNAYVSTRLSQLIPPSPSPAAFTSLFSMSVSFFIPALQKGSSVPFSRVYIYALIYDICVYLSDLLHFV